MNALSRENVRPLRVRLFGSPIVRYGETDVRFVAARTLPLLAYLLLERRASISRERLAYTLWPDVLESQARSNLRRHLHRIHEPLEEITGVRWLVADEKTVGFDPDLPLDLDVAALEAAIADPARAPDAVDLYTGDLLDVFDADWIIPHRERLRTGYLQLLVHLIDRYRGERRFSEAIVLSRRMLFHDPLREDAVRALMSLHYEAGDRASALGEYKRFRDVLAREIGTEPMPETQSLHDAIRRHVAVRGAALQRAASPALPFVGRDPELAQLRSAWRAAASGSGRVAFVSGEAGIGKTRLLREFVTIVEREGARVLWGASSTPEAMPYEPIVEALGVAIGEIARSSLAPAPLGALANTFPELLAMRPDLVRTVAPEERARDRFFDGVVLAIERLSAARPTIIVAEDVHCVRADTLALLARIVHACARSSVLVIISFREEDASVALRAFCRDTAPRRSLRLGLGRLDPAASYEIIERGLPEVAEAVGKWAVALAMGNPLFLGELLRENASQDVDAQAGCVLPSSLRAVILRRLSALSMAARSLVDIAAIGGAVVMIDVLRHASGWSLAEIGESLDELIARFVLRETAMGSRGDCAFSHDLIREAIVEAMPEELRARRHGRFAKAILALYPERTDEFARVLAAHFEAAGRAEDAAQWFARAARLAYDRFAWHDAIALAERAVRSESQPRARFASYAILESAARACGDECRPGAVRAMLDLAELIDDDDLRIAALLRSAELLQGGDFEGQRAALDRAEAIAMERGDLRTRCTVARCRARALGARGRPRAALAELQSIDALGTAGRSPIEMSEDHRALAFAHVCVVDFEAACAAMDEAERYAGEDADAALRLENVRMRALIAVNRSDRDEAARLSPVLLELCRTVGDVEGEGDAHHHAACVATWSFNVASARHHFHAAASIFERIGKPQLRAYVLTNAGVLANGLGLLDEAERLYTESLAFADQVGHARLQAINHGNLAYAALCRGDYASACEHAERARDFAAGVPDLLLVASSLRYLGWAIRERDLYDGRSLRYFEKALTICEAHGFEEKRLDIVAEMIPTLLAEGDRGRACMYSAEVAAAIQRDPTALELPVHALLLSARAHDGADDERALELRERARVLFTERLALLPDRETQAAYAALRLHLPLGATASHGATNGSLTRP